MTYRQELERMQNQIEQDRRRNEEIKQADKRNIVFLVTVLPTCWIVIGTWLYCSSFQAPLYLAIMFGFVFAWAAMLFISIFTPGVALPVCETSQPQGNAEVTRAVTQIAQIEQYRIFTDLGKPGGGR